MVSGVVSQPKKGFWDIPSSFPPSDSPAFNPRPGSAPLPASPPPGPKKIAAPQFRTWSPTALLSVALSSLTSVDRTGNSASCLVWPQPNYKKNNWPLRSKFNLRVNLPDHPQFWSAPPLTVIHPTALTKTHPPVIQFPTKTKTSIAPATQM